MAMQVVRGVILAASLAGLAGCIPSSYVNYFGSNYGRPPKPIQAMEVLRSTIPEGRFQDLGTVNVTCPTHGGGCSYEWAVWQACDRAAANGGDGIHAIDTAVNANGRVVSLVASVFVRLPPHVEPAPPPPAARDDRAPKPPVEERLRRLDQLKADGVITPEEHAKRREEILKEI
jgi:hypothetical protein